MTLPDHAHRRHGHAARISITFFLMLGFACATATGQVSTKVASINPTETSGGLPLTLSISLNQGESIERVYFAYRAFGERSYTTLEMSLLGNTASVHIPAGDVQPPFLEYYVVLVDRSGNMETYPISESTDPLSSPPTATAQMVVRPAQQENPEILFLSPDRMARLQPEDVVISVSLLRTDSLVVRRATQLLFDGLDITRDAVFSDDIIVYVPETSSSQLAPGNHTVTVRLFNREGHLHRTASLTFNVVGSGKTAEAPQTIFTYGGTVQMESRHEMIAGTGTWYNRGSLALSGQTGIWRINSELFITSDEKTTRQPQNRYFVGASSPWLKAGYGDSYPSFPNLIMSGKRLRGLNTSLTLGFFNVDVALGKTVRPVEGALNYSFPVESLATEQLRDPAAPYAPIDAATWGKFSYGTYGRKLFAIRPSFGTGETWQFGLTWLKSKDDMESIRYGVRPQENLVVGSDFVLRLDSRNIELGGQGAFSAFNSDISSGTFSDATIDSLIKDEQQRRDAKRVRDLLQSIITVNENLSPLSFKKLSTLAYEGYLSLNYFDNAVKFTYLYRGNNYNSFGQTFLRKDIKGYRVEDRIRLVQNQVFVSVGYERLQDNVSNTKIAATTYSTFTLATSYYSRSDAPNVTIGFSRFSNGNGLGLSGPDSLSAVDDATNRYFLQSSYDFTLGAAQSARVSLSTSNRDDQSLRDMDVKNVVISFGLGTRYRFPLETDIDCAVNLNTLPGTGTTPGYDLNYTSLTLAGRYWILTNVLSCNAGYTPTFGDFTRTGVELGTQWKILPVMSVLLQFNHFDNRGFADDNIWSLRYRYDL